MPKVDRLFSLLLTIFDLLRDALRFIRHSLQPRCTLAAESLFLRKQLALYLERQVEPRRPRAAAKLTLVVLSRLFPWRQALTIVKPDTFIRWHRQGFRLFWKRKSAPSGRPRISLPNSRTWMWRWLMAILLGARTIRNSWVPSGAGAANAALVS